jgi:hypothetical protein
MRARAYRKVESEIERLGVMRSRGTDGHRI